jgi:hypothetical protein
MTLKTSWRILLGGMLLATASCGLTEPKPLLDEFTWEAVENTDEVQEGVDMAAFFGDVNFLGQFKTPTLCYNLGAKVDVDDSRIEIVVTAGTSNSTACAQTAGGFRYQGAVRNLKKGTYTVHIVHVITGLPNQEFTETLKM